MEIGMPVFMDGIAAIWNADTKKKEGEKTEKKKKKCKMD